MSFKASSVILVKGYEQIKQSATVVKRRAEGLRDLSAAGDVLASVIVGFVREVVDARERMQVLASTPGLANYAKSQEDDQPYDVVAEYTAMVTGINNAVDWVYTNFPKDGNGYLLKDKISQDGTLTSRSFSSTETASLRTQLDALIALID